MDAEAKDVARSTMKCAMASTYTEENQPVIQTNMDHAIFLIVAAFEAFKIFGPVAFILFILIKLNSI